MLQMLDSGDFKRQLRERDATIRRQQAAIGALEQELRRTRNELELARGEIRSLHSQLMQEREIRRRTQDNLADALRAMQNVDERVQALMRRQYHTSSERMIADAGQTYLTEIIEQVRDEHGELLADLLKNGEHQVSSDDAHHSDDGGADDSSIQKPKGKRRPANAGGRKPLPADLPREASIYQPAAGHPLLAMADLVEQIGTTIVERLDIVPFRLMVQELTCPVFRLHLPGGIVTQQTCTPPGVIDRSQVSDRFLVTSAIDKVQDHLPAYRQQCRFARIGVDIPRSKICRWHMSLADFLSPVAETILDAIRREPVVGIDDTVHRLVVPDRHVCKKGRLIAVSGQAGIFYQFQETRESRWFSQMLANYTGGVMGDAYSGHHQLLARDDILALFCWAHARRKFFESADARRRSHILALIGKLYAVEDTIADRPPDERIVQRRRHASPVLAQIYELLTSWQTDPAVLPKSGIGKATNYVLKRWDGFTAYLDQGHARIDNNRTEQGMRPNALHRKNSLFSASPRGARSYATLLTLAQSAWLHDLDPHAYLLDVIDCIHHRARPLDQLTPAAYANAGRCLVGKPS